MLVFEDVGVLARVVVDLERARGRHEILLRLSASAGAGAAVPLALYHGATVQNTRYAVTLNCGSACWLARSSRRALGLVASIHVR